MSENKTGRYFKYAIGEIILVVIGILIALQVNNLNERKKIAEGMTSKLEALVENLENEIEVSGIQFHPKRIYDYQKLLDGKLTLDSLRLNASYKSQFSFLTTRLKDDVLEENIDILIENEDRLPKKYKDVVGLMKSLKFYFLVYKKSIQKIRMLQRNNEEYLENNFSWYALSDSESNEKRHKYLINDPFYKNRLYTFLESYKTSYRLYSIVIVRKLEILCAIKLLDKNYTADDLRRYLKSNKFYKYTDGFINEAKKVSCLEESNQDTWLPSAHLIINLSKDSLEIKEPNATFTRFSLPNQSDFYVNNFDNIIRISKENSCKAYKVAPLDFIIIE